VWDLIRQNADDLGTAGWDQYYGWGRINVAKTVAAAKIAVPVASDTSKPTTTITAPSSGSTVSGAVTIKANATDNSAVTSVELYKDNTLYATANVSPYTFYWDTTKDTIGTHTLQTKAYDAAKNVGVSGITSVTAVTAPEVGSTTDMVAPKVTISSPKSGTKVKGNGILNISVTASDTSGISSIIIAADGTTLATCANITTCTASWSGKQISNGTHTISATAIDASANKNSAAVATSITK
jgi:thermitase